ncbi:MULTISPECIES: hypothetical protein [Ramlibacter]|uniref:MFS transporter n=1 Tax=Ramlibacter aquaticus TaxID=2780094 RepID=A0ABR9SAZ3_9BURK|nr:MULTISPECIES: hypothetical protein [Ramlibacter]MBE7939519.1 hypothetical protein [Ramlibacter aquaticus]
MSISLYAAATPALLGRGLGTLAAVAMALVLLRKGGHVLAGLVAAIPVTSVPALAWLGRDHGAAFAAAAALSALYATGLTALHTLFYALAARRHGRALALGASTAGTLAVCAGTRFLMGDGVGVLLFTLACFAIAYAGMPPVQAPPAHSHARVRDISFSAGVSGLVSMIATLASREAPAQWCGLVATIPVVGITTMVLVHGRWPLANLRAFLRSYVHGLVAKAFFLGTLAATLVPLGLVGGWLSALVAGALPLLARQCLAQREDPALLHGVTVPTRL